MGVDFFYFYCQTKIFHYILVVPIKFFLFSSPESLHTNDSPALLPLVKQTTSRDCNACFRPREHDIFENYFIAFFLRKFLSKSKYFPLWHCHFLSFQGMLSWQTEQGFEQTCVLKRYIKDQLWLRHCFWLKGQRERVMLVVSLDLSKRLAVSFGSKSRCQARVCNKCV